MPRADQTARKKARILRWNGVLADTPSILRRAIGIVLAVAGVALTFTQLGFFDLVLRDGTVGYVVVLLQVVALGALLLGTLTGTALGLFVGTVLLIHARALPLDHYELAFVTPATSVVMLGICGLLLGVLFAFALRNDPSQVKRIVYIAIVCIVVSWLYSAVFASNAIVLLTMEIVERSAVDVTDSFVQQRASSIAMQLGDLGVQARSTGLFMVAICCIGDLVARKIKERRGTLGIRPVFGVWLAIVVALGFMTMSAVSFAVTSADELRDAEDLMNNETTYLCNQLRDTSDRSKRLLQFADSVGIDYTSLDMEKWDNFSSIVSADALLQGYSREEDGLVVISVDNLIAISDDPRYSESAYLDEAFSPGMLEAMEQSLETGRMQRFIYYGPQATSENPDASEYEDGRPHIAYLLAKRQSLDEAGYSYSYVVTMMQPSNQVFAKRMSVMVGLAVSEFVLLLGVFFGLFQLLDRTVARPIDATNAALARITAGDLDARVEQHGTREFESLSEGINGTVDALKGWILEAETRMDAELATASAIQESALPGNFPPYPDIMKFDIYASMDAARQVGGDFYDFFLIGDSCNAFSGKLGFVVADVSGKGVPAALFMMKAKALLHEYVASGIELGEAVEEANRQLVDGNDEGMFVTAWVGVLDYGTGHVDYVNAGHNPPLLWQRDVGWQWMREKSGPVLGLFEMPYEAHSVDCIAGDTFLLYTDGVTEAFSINEELYGEKRLLDVAEKGYRLHPRDLLDAVRDDVDRYAEGAEQSDDITILTLEVGVPPEVTATLEVLARIENLERVNEFLHEELDRRLCPKRTQNQLDIAVEELFVNVCRYAYPRATPKKPGRVRIQRTYKAEPPSVTVDIIDSGIPYNPLAKPDAVTPDDIEDVPIGGLGILMAKRSVDDMSYERADDRNIVTIVKRW